MKLGLEVVLVVAAVWLAFAGLDKFYNWVNRR